MVRDGREMQSVGRSRLRVLVLSFTFPNARQPALGVFIHERVRRVASRCQVKVMAPVPWFPLNRLIRGPQWAEVPAAENIDGLDVRHPRFLSVPGCLKWLDGILYALCLVPVLWRLRRSFPFDLIDAHFAYPDGLAAVVLGRVFRCRVVITLRGSIVRLSTYPLHRPQLRLALRAADRVLAVSASLKRTAMDLGIPAEKIRVISNGVDTERFFPIDRGQARAELGLPGDRPIILSVGGLNEGKGQHRIVRLLPLLRRRYPDLLYVIVGGERRADSLRPTIERLMRDLGLERHVLLVGEKPHDEIPRWMGACNVFCLATRSEGWANVLLEALACGRPVVSTRVGGNAEIVTSPTLGTLVPADDDRALGEAIQSALDQRWDAAILARHARRHSWEAATNDVLAEFRRLVPEDVGPVLAAERIDGRA
jgi:glycosyltransferase involved in cell wall biosynthesis